jgi:DNA-binding LacI/PurR family transcriptional regulator/signal transduction histidine kinase
MTLDGFSGDDPITTVSARSRDRGPRKRILVLSDHIDHVSGGYEPQLRAAFDTSCRRHELDLAIVVGRAFNHPEPAHAAQNAIYELLGAGSGDGVIFLSAALAAYSGTESIANFRQRFGALPMCSVGAQVEGIPSVVVDNRPGMRALLDHVIGAHGRRRLAFVTGTPKNPNAEARLQAYREALAEHGIPYDSRLVVAGLFHPASGAKAVEELLQRNVAFDALIVSNDAMALTAIDTLKTRGLRVPRDVVVTGFDDLVLARLASPPLTTVRQPLERMGILAVELILRQMGGENVPILSELPVEFVVRESCGCRFVAEPRPEQASVSLRPTARSDEDRARLARRIAGDALEAEGARAAWVTRLLDGFEDELEAVPGAFLGALEELLDEFGDAHEAFEKLRRAVVVLAEELRSSRLESLWQSAHRAIEAAMARALARQKLAIDAVFQKLLRSGERLSTASLDWEELERVMAEELCEVGLQNACVSLIGARGRQELQPFVWIHQGVGQRALPAEFEASELIVPEACDRRRTWFALPLTFEMELLGVAAFELGSGMAVHEMLRGQVSAALKSAALHREIVRTTELHVRSVQERVATSNRMASLSVLAGGVAHDLNNALGPLVTLPDVILSELEDLKRGELSDDRELRADVITIKSSALRAAQTIKDLMLLGRPGATSKESHDLNDIVASFAAADPLRLPGQRGSGIPLRIDLAGEALAVTVSESHVVRALTNLVRNAAEAMREAGHITIRTRAVVLGSELQRHETIPAGKYAAVSVMDTGDGIAEADLFRIFEPFFSTKRLVEHSGSGLGLAIVHGVVKEHSGYLDVESTPGAGTTFTLYFPSAAEASEPSRVISVLPRDSQRILVIDDEAEQRHLAGRVLRHSGYTVDTLGSGREAVALYARLHSERNAPGAPPHDSKRPELEPPYELVVLDFNLQEEQTGLEVLRNLRRLYPSQRALVVSGRARIEDADMAPLPWLAKPYAADDLAYAVEQALELETLPLPRVS